MTFQLITPADAEFPIGFLTLKEGIEEGALAWLPLTCCDYSPVELDPLPPLETPQKV